MEPFWDPFDTVTTSAPAGFLHVSNTKNGTLGSTLRWHNLSAFSGNGYIEGKELENFFRELEMARKGAGVVSPRIRFSALNEQSDFYLDWALFSFSFLLGSNKPHIQRKDERVHAEVWQKQRWANWDVRGKASVSTHHLHSDNNNRYLDHSIF